MDPTAIDTTSNGWHLFSHGTDNFCNISGYGHFTPNENDGQLYPSNYSDPYAGCFTCLILFKLYNNPTGYILSLPFCTRKDWGLDDLVCLTDLVCLSPIAVWDSNPHLLASFPSADGPPYPLDGLTTYHAPLCRQNRESGERCSCS